MERNMIEAASVGAIVNKTLRDAKELINVIVVNSQQFGLQQDTTFRRMNEASISTL